MCEIDVDGTCEVWREKTATARKQHKCGACGSRIAPGEQYINLFSVYEGHQSTEKGCMNCEPDRQEFCRAHHISLGPASWVDSLFECVYEEGESESSQWLPLVERLKERRALAKAVAP